MRKHNEEKFFSLVDKSGECWLWRGPINADGCGLFHMNGETETVQRFMWKLHYGEEAPRGMFLAKICGEKLCVKPEHMEVSDRPHFMKGNIGAPKGEANGRAKVSDAGVRSCVEEHGNGVGIVDLALKYDVAETTVGNWIRGRYRNENTTGIRHTS